MSREPSLSPLSLESIPARWWRGRRVLMRLDLNIPTGARAEEDHLRIQRSLISLRWLTTRGARVVILSHWGQDGRQSLRPLARQLNNFLPTGFVPRATTLPAVMERLGAGRAVLLENLRRDPGEMKNHLTWSKLLARAGEVFVNDAFSASHRRHASIIGLPRLLPAYAGRVLLEEISQLSRLFKPRAPFVVVLGGAKFSTKLPTVKRFLSLADEIFIGGALAHPFFRQRGYSVGRSLIADTPSAIKMLLRSPRIKLPHDVVARSASGAVRISTPAAIGPTDEIVDIGPDSLKKLAAVITPAKTILWNGPLGLTEAGFAAGTEKLARAIADHPAYSVIGGGDTLAAVAKLKLFSRFSFVSTGGGALLEFLATGTLPGIEALRASQRRFRLVRGQVPKTKN